MALSILFWVRKSAANSKGFAPLKVRLTLPGNDKCDFSSGHTVHVDLWNPVKKRVGGNSAEAARVNLYISRSETKLQDIYDDLVKEDREISGELIKNIFLGKAQQRLTLLNCLKEHNDHFLEQIEITGKGEVSTVLKFQVLGDKLKKFMGFKYSRKDYFVSEIDYSFIQDFRTWLLMYGHKDGTGLAPDSATGNMKRLKKVLDNLFKRGLIKSDPFIDIKLRWETPSAEGINETDLKKFEALNISLPRLQKVKDRFIVGCYSGLAHADISKCKRDDLIKNFGSDGNWIKVWRQKTKSYCKVPVLEPVQAIIDKYWNDERCIRENRLFPIVGLQSANNYLKELGSLCSIEKTLSTHVARHYFSIMALNMGVSLDVIAEILGHRNVATTRNVYARMNHTRVSSEMKSFSEKRFPVMKIVEEEKNAG